MREKDGKEMVREREEEAENGERRKEININAQGNI